MLYPVLDPTTQAWGAQGRGLEQEQEGQEEPGLGLLKVADPPVFNLIKCSSKSERSSTASTSPP